MAYKCPKCGGTHFEADLSSGMYVCKCGNWFGPGEAAKAVGKVAGGGTGGQGAGGGTGGQGAGGGTGGQGGPKGRDWGGKLFAALTIAKVVWSIVFFIAIEISLFNFISFFVNCLELKAFGFGMGLFIFIIGLLITIALWEKERSNSVRILIVFLLVFFSFLIPGLALPHCAGGLEFTGEVWHYFICTFKNLGSPQNCISYKDTQTIQPDPDIINQFKPIKIEFGSKYTPTPYTPPTLYANDKYGYSLILTVINPNIDLTVDGFYIESYSAEPGENNNSDMIGLNSRKIMCGKTDICNETHPCRLLPDSHKEIILNFSDGGDCKSASNLTVSISEDSCKDRSLNDTDGCLLETDLKTKNILGCSKQPESCLKVLCKKRCTSSYSCVNFTDFTNITNRKCVCIRERNNFTDLCCGGEFGSEIKIRFFARHNFSAIGIGEFRVAETERYLNYKPEIKSSAGPLVTTVYFQPYAILSDKPRDILMYINLKNEGEGSIDINSINIKQRKDKIGFLEGSIIKCMQDTMTRKSFLNSKQSVESVCRLELEQADITTFSTIKMDVETNYTYTWVEKSKNLQLARTYFNPTTEQQYIGIPGYCPRD